MNRSLAALLVGLITFLCIADISAGYLNFGVLPNLGTLQRIDGSRSVYTSVTQAGQAAGIQPGDVRDLRAQQFLARFMLATTDEAGRTYDIALFRNGATVHAHLTFVPRRPTVLDLLDVIMRVLLAAAGVFLIARGTANDSLYAGLFVCALSVYEGFAVHFWGPPGVTVAMQFYEGLPLGIAAWSVRFAFAFSILPDRVPNRLRAALIWLAIAATAIFSILSLIRRIVDIFTASVSVPISLYFLAQMAASYLAVFVLGVAAYYVRGKHAAAVRWIFAGMLISLIGPTINWVSGIIGVPLPASGSLNVTYLVLALVLPYAVLARGLVAVDFVVSRALVYTIVLSVIVGIFIVAEKIIEQAALGRVQSYVFELLVPLALGFSIKWIEKWVESIVERVLYRDKMRAAAEIEALIEDFPHARDVRAITARVANEVHRQMRSQFVCVYREAESTYSPVAQAGHGEPLPVDADDPIFLRLRSKHAALHTGDFATALPKHGAVFPLVVFGGVTGALYAQYRESGERFDPDELQTLARLAHELAIALLWVEREGRPGGSESVSGPEFPSLSP